MTTGSWVGEEKQSLIFSCLLIDPEVHPQSEDYWGHVNPIGPRACYDEGKRVAETMCYAYMKQVLVETHIGALDTYETLSVQDKPQGW